jgi:uncharacterized membrane protein
MNHENLNTSEIIGIGLRIFGILFLSLSGMAIYSTLVRATLANHGALQRIAAFTASFFLFSFTTRSLASRIKNRKGMLIALANGFLACLSDFWITPLLALVVIVLGGHGINVQMIIFTIASLILIMCATVITWQNQLAFKDAQASNVVPVGQVPIQIAPILVFLLSSPSPRRVPLQSSSYSLEPS